VANVPAMDAGQVKIEHISSPKLSTPCCSYSNVVASCPPMPVVLTRVDAPVPAAGNGIQRNIFVNRQTSDNVSLSELSDSLYNSIEDCHGTR
jgi:hypothetical protein